MTLTSGKSLAQDIPANKAIVRQIFEEAFSKKRTELLKELIDDEFEGARGGKGYAAFLEPVKPLLVAFPDIEWKILDIISEENKVMLHWKWQGTHQAQYTKFPPTGKTFTNDGMAVFVLKNGKVISSVIITDRLGFQQQMGAIPVNL
jgi:steroid delta-isomerase-like uncharacterized protein